MTKRRPLALGAALAIGFGTIFAATPAFAEQEIPQPVETTEETAAPLIDEIDLDDVERIAALLEDQGVELYGSVTAAGGDRVLLTSTVESAEAEQALEAVVASEGADRYLELSGPGRLIADTDVVGGAGYLGWLPDYSNGAHCSLGFAAWDSTGDPAIVTAGHCSLDGAIEDVELTLPSAQPGAPGGGSGSPETPTYGLGSFGFNQFGGPGNSTGAENAPNSIDIAIIEDINPALDLLPAVTNWGGAATADDLASDTTWVTSAGVVGEGDVRHSGRTTGSKSGEVLFLDGWLQVYGHDYPDDPSDIRWVRGFGAEMNVDGGDSGGAIVQGGTAVGIASAEAQLTDGTEIVWGAHLVSSLEQISEDYEIALYIADPSVTSHASGAELAPGEAISGDAPSNAETVSYSFAQGSGDGVPVSNGSWTVNAPTTPGDYTLSFTARAGSFNHSDTVTFDFSVVAAPVEAPAITSPADGSTVEAPVETIRGTGVAGATLTLSGAVTATVEVAADGSWSVPASLGEGAYTVTAFQTLGGERSPSVTSSFTVVPVPPAAVEITSIADGAQFVEGSAPTRVSGTGEPGAEIFFEFAKDGVVVATQSPIVVDENGEWSTSEFDGPLGVGKYIALAAYQDAEGTPSDVNSVVSFSVVAEDDGGQTPPPPGGDDEELAQTGSPAATLPLVGGAIALLLGGAVTFLIARRRRA